MAVSEMRGGGKGPGQRRNLPVVRWFQAGAVAAGVGAALIAAPAIAAADDGGASPAPTSHSSTSGKHSAGVGGHRPSVQAAAKGASAKRAAKPASASAVRPSAATGHSARVVAGVDRTPAAGVDSTSPVTQASAAVTTSSTSSSEVVTGLFREILRTDPTAEQLQRYSNLYNLLGTRAVVFSLYNSQPFRQQQVNNYFRELLGRAPTQAEMALGTVELAIGVPEPLVVAQIASGAEFYRASGGTATTYVSLLYRSMLGEPADAGQSAVYVQQLRAGLPTQVVALQFVTADAFRAVKVNEIYQVVLGRDVTDTEIQQYVDRWYWNRGLAGIAMGLLSSSANVARMTAGDVPLPDMVAVSQLQQILLAAYDEDPTGFVNLFNTYLKTDPVTGALCVSTCNTPLLELIRTGGATRGIPNEAIQITPINADVTSLIPTQNEVDVDKSIKYPLQNADQLEAYLQGGALVPGGSIVTADGGTYIVDGHHRWSGIYVINPYAQISAIDLGYVPNAQEALKEMQVSIAAEQGYLNVQTVQGQNLFTISKDDFDTQVALLIAGGDDPAAVMKVFADERNLTTMTQVQNYLWENVLRMRQFNQPITGATSRGYMPQPPDEGLSPLLHWMESGDLSYTLPVISYLG
ncbi:hypothetical protein [Mycobacterium sp. shizuoka-1]|uniref:hypothetical protein n=1 Tax=Mycobacterium sp. shizuoka-1 TaxID=2039281 RepID=UPI000C064B7C|nr:hypothetical protein [Mycobacterium sp. shizuoka-1]GAY17711.1 hypothetical protein MSZK_44370 [Mycobacterium sp. shizuoka-1]